MIEVLFALLFCWIFFHAIRLIFKITWSFARVAAVILMVIALPSLIGCLLLASGIALLIPVLIIALAWGILKACV